MWRLTDSRFGTGEAAVFRHQVSVVAFAGQNLLHISHFLAPALLGTPVDSEPDVRSVAGKLPPGNIRGTKYSFKMLSGLLDAFHPDQRESRRTKKHNLWVDFLHI